MAQAFSLPAALAETTEFYWIDASAKLDPKKRSALGQFMTPAIIGRYMASLFGNLSGEVSLLDPGAGVGSLSAAVIERACNQKKTPKSISVNCYEIESLLTDYLSITLTNAERQCESQKIKFLSTSHHTDFIIHSQEATTPDLFRPGNDSIGGYTHVLMNPPYKKINSASVHRTALREAGIETSNLYTGFMYLAAKQLKPRGELVAIVPRSFCNGPYFKPFREQFFAMMGLQHIHIFEARNSAFKGDEVLQENIILHAIKGMKPKKVTITTSRAGDFHLDVKSNKYITEDMTHRVVPYSSVIKPHDPDAIIHIAANELDQRIVDRLAHFTHKLSDLGLEVSTGPVVDFRMKEYLCNQPEKNSVPLLYATHFQKGNLEWPKKMKKPNAIAVSDNSRKWLWENKGHFVITKRFSSKEEKRRIVASVYDASLPGDLIGFENHLNVFHTNQKGIPKELALGLYLYLNSTVIDRYFRQFNGHTQVNASDLRSLHYPSQESLENMGKHVKQIPLPQDIIDNIIEGELAPMTDDKNLLLVEQKINEAQEIVRALGMPKGQQNERSALTLLALLGLKPSGRWDELDNPLMGITPIMDFCREHYGKNYAPNTRETFRRQTMHQFVEAGIALYNPDKPDRAVNSPKACYQISEVVFQTLRTFGTDQWNSTLETYLKIKEPLADIYARKREMQQIPLKIAEGMEVKLTPGDHSGLIKKIIEEFAPRFASGSEVIYVGDTGSKVGYFQIEKLSSLGVTVDRHGKLPDVILYFSSKNWLLLVEAVTSHGPVDAKRHNELAQLFAGATPGLVYVTAFHDRSIMGRYLTEISWETEVWCSDAPTHLIHFNGARFLGPYQDE